MKLVKALAVVAACLAAASCMAHVPLKPSGTYVIFFDRGEGPHPRDGKDVLVMIAEAYKAEGRSAVAIECFSDNTSGNEAANIALTKKRAVRTKRDLIKLGVPLAAISAAGKGSSEALVPGVTGEHRGL